MNGKRLYYAIVVRTICDITTDADKLLNFMRKAEMLNVSVCSVEVGMNLAYLSTDGGMLSIDIIEKKVASVYQ